MGAIGRGFGEAGSAVDTGFLRSKSGGLQVEEVVRHGVIPFVIDTLRQRWDEVSLFGNLAFWES